VLLVAEWSELAPSDQAKLAAQVEAALVSRRLSSLSAQDAMECSEPPPGVCPDALHCQVEQAERCEADYILKIRVARPTQAAGELRAELAVVDVSVGEVAAEDSLSCSGCEPQALFANLKERLAALFDRSAGRGRGRIELGTEPPGAEVFLDGRLVGKTPYKAAAFSGPRRIELKLDGYKSHDQELALGDGATAQLDLPLSLLAEPAPAQLEPPSAPLPPPRRPRWRLATGGVLIGIGLTLSGFGGAALSLDGSQTVSQCGDPTPMNRACIFHTQNLGIGLLASGLTLAVGGAILIAIPPPKRARASSR
jgi:hypothetical protein